MNKIKILLVDDNPTSLMENEGKGAFIPSFEFGYSDSEFSQTAISTNFELGWLQSPRDVREFRVFSEEVIQEFGHTALSDEGFVPEIVLFDYKLSEGLDKFFDCHLEEYESIIPTHKLSKKISKKPHRFFDWKELKNELNTELKNVEDEIQKERISLTDEDKLNLAKTAVKKVKYESTKTNEPDFFLQNNDDMGCFSGGLIAFQFKDHPCIGVPITSKEGEINVSKEALYFEWLLSHDFNDQFGKKYGRKPFWNEVIPQAVQLLRNRIELLVKLGKITPFYEQLIRLSKADTTENAFSFISIYGEKHLPLDGLFVDEPEETRIQKIKDWAEELIKLLPLNTHEINRAITVSEELWGVFTERFGDRMELSNLVYWESVGRKLNTDEEKRLAELKGEFCKEGEIEERSIRNYFPDRSNKVNHTLRLVVLLTAANAAIEMNKCKEHSRNKELYGELSKDEYFNLLFPIVKLKNDLILPIHKETGKDDLFETDRGWAYRKLGLKSQSDWLNFESWIEPGEKLILKSIYFGQNKYYPEWLK